MSLVDNGSGLSAADIAAVVGNNGNGFGFGNVIITRPDLSVTY